MSALASKIYPESEAARLQGLYGHLSGRPLLEALIENGLRGQILLSSSFGAESAVLLDLVAEVDPTIPVIFLDTRRLFGETLRYQKQLTELLGLKDVRIISPDAETLRRVDPDDMLFNEDPDKCCHIRKVAPLDNIMTELANSGFKAWITGRKQFQSATRSALPTIEQDGDFIKINPLADWTNDDIRNAFRARNLPPHPLVADGFKSIGCMPCTSRVADGADPRSGRWAGRAKTECGIHTTRRAGLSAA